MNDDISHKDEDLKSLTDDYRFKTIDHKLSLIEWRLRKIADFCDFVKFIIILVGVVFLWSLIGSHWEAIVAVVLGVPYLAYQWADKSGFLIFIGFLVCLVGGVWSAWSVIKAKTMKERTPFLWGVFIFFSVLVVNARDYAAKGEAEMVAVIIALITIVGAVIFGLIYLKQQKIKKQ